MTGMSWVKASVARVMKQRADGPSEAQLSDLHDSYVWHANAAVSARRDYLASNLAQEFLDEALALLVRPHR
jgi:hypothetical protein